MCSKLLRPNAFRLYCFLFSLYGRRIRNLKRSTGIRKPRFRYSWTPRSAMVFLPTLTAGRAVRPPYPFASGLPMRSPPTFWDPTRVPQPIMRFTPFARAPRAARAIITDATESSWGSRTMAAIPMSTALRMG